MIVVEGPDGAGKTTLVEQLLYSYNLNLQPKAVASNTNAMVDLKLWVEQHNAMETWPADRQLRLYDRHRLISGFIYQPILHRAVTKGFENLDWVRGALFEFYTIQRPIIIYCLPPLEEVRNNVNREDTDNSVVAHVIDNIWSAYSRLAANDCLFHGALLWDYTRNNMPWLKQQIQEVSRGKRSI